MAEKIDSIAKEYESKLSKISAVVDQLKAVEAYLKRRISPKEREIYQRKIKRLNHELDLNIIDFLIFRDSIEENLFLKNGSSLKDLNLIHLDEEFVTKSQSGDWANKITRLRKSYNPTVNESSWWWFTEEILSKLPERASHFVKTDWFLKFLLEVTWLFSLALLFNISSKIIAGNPDLIGTWTVIINTLLGLLVAQGILFGTSKWVEHAVNSLGIQKRLQIPVRVGLATFVLCIVWTLHSDLEMISDIYYDRAESFYHPQEHQISSILESQNIRFHFYKTIVDLQPGSDAYADYYRAIQLNPQNWRANNRLGEILEDRQEMEEAIKYYQIASNGGLPEAFINLGRYHSLYSQKYMVSMGFLQNAKDSVNNLGKKCGDPNTHNDPDKSNKCSSHHDRLEYDYEVHFAWTYLLFAKSEREKKPESNFVYLLDTAMSHVKDIDKKHEDAIFEKTGYCIRAEILAAYPPKSSSVPQKEFDIEHEWNKCKKIVEDIEGILRPYEAERLIEFRLFKG